MKTSHGKPDSSCIRPVEIVNVPYIVEAVEAREAFSPFNSSVASHGSFSQVSIDLKVGNNNHITSKGEEIGAASSSPVTGIGDWGGRLSV